MIQHVCMSNKFPSSTIAMANVELETTMPRHQSNRKNTERIERQEYLLTGYILLLTFAGEILIAV